MLVLLDRALEEEEFWHAALAGLAALVMAVLLLGLASVFLVVDRWLLDPRERRRTCLASAVGVLDLLLAAACLVSAPARSGDLLVLAVGVVFAALGVGLLRPCGRGGGGNRDDASAG